MSLDPKVPYDLDICVDASDIDLIGHVNNIVYLRWVQEAAIAHWTAFADAQEVASLLWVVMRHEIDYKRPTYLEDAVIARTWIGGRDQRLFERFTDIIRKEDGKLLAKARTLWCPIHAQSKKAARLTPEQIARYSASD